MRLFFVLLIFSTAVKAQYKSPVIEIDPAGHSGKILAVSYTPSGDTLVSVSEDKTIRLWDVESGEMLKRYQALIGEGYKGMFYTADISPDGRHLAVAGYPAAGNTNYILIVDLIEGKQINRVLAHNDVINKLLFSKDGKFLISGGDDGVINTFNVENLGTIKKAGSIQLDTRIADLALNPLSNMLAVASDRSEILVYNVAAIINNFKNIDPLILEQHKDLVHRVSYSANGTYLASSSLGGELLLWRNDGSLVQELQKNGNVVNAINFSANGEILVAMDVYGMGKSYSIPSGNILSSFDDHDNTVFCAEFSPQAEIGNYVVATAGGNDNIINFWNPLNGNSLKSISGVGSTIWRLKFDQNNNLLVGRSPKENGSFSQVFNLYNFSINAVDQAYSTDINREIRQTDLYTLKVSRGEIVNDEYEDGKILAFKKLGDGKIIVGSDFSLKLYSEDGTLIKEFVGHTGGVRALAVSPDQKYLVSGSEDQTIKLWKLDESGEFPSLSEKFNSSDWQEYFKAMNLDQYVRQNTRQAWKESIDILKKLRDKNFKNIEDIYALSAERISPFINLFLAENNEWILWSPTGYFNSSSKGGNYFGWHVNRGPEKLADFYKADQYFDLLYRPDIIKASIEKGKRVEEVLVEEGEQIVDVAKLNRPSAAFFNINSIQALANDSITYRGGKYLTEKTQITLNVELFDGGGGIKEINIYHNNKLIISDDGIKSIAEGANYDRNYVVDLINGMNEFEVTVLNYQKIESRADPFRIEYTGEMTATSNLFILAVGINEYKNSKYNLNYAVADANSFVDKLEKISKDIFKNVRVLEIYDRDATKANISRAFETMKNLAKPQDVFVFYYAGHGTLDEDDNKRYYFVPTDVTSLYGDSQQLREKAISADELKDYLTEIKPQKQLILMDACHSGGALNTIRTRAGSSEERAMVQLARASGVVMIASSGTEQFASEFEILKHGVFTYSLLEALDGKADNGDAKITVAELKLYMEERVPELSEIHGGTAQYPTGFTHGNDFPIAIIK